MASITKRGKKWQVRVSYKDKNGDWRTKTKGGFNTKKEAEIYGTDMQRDVNNDELITKSTPFPEYFWNWFELFKEKNVNSRTYTTYKHTYRILEEYFKNIPVDKMTRKKYQEFLNDYGKNHAKSTMTKLNSLVRSCIDNAVYDNDIKKDFTKNVEVVFNKDRSQKIEYLSIEDMNKMADYILNNLNVNYTSPFMILVAIYTGMRLGEIQGLQWQDINWNFKTISVKRSWDADKREFIPTKNESSKRTIRINQTLLDTLNQLRLAYNPSENDQVFLNQTKNVPTSDAANKVLRNIMKKAEIRRAGFHFHSLRHTHVAYLLANHIDLYVISKRLGHSDIATTSRVYSYLIDEYKVQSDNEIEAVLDKMDNPDTPHSQTNKNLA
ncbi:tyrosine-type recombinase/integrase [Lentilactobacillus senioris]|uniref:site-specific integrase n=1 Tax=Lentilactobacillus senioris TaxID=931534 RepID=UPI003D2CE755